MPRENLSPTFVSAMMGREAGIVVLNLVDIEHEDLDEPIRIVNNTEDVICNGHTYTAMGFEVRLPEERDGTPRGATIRVDNTTQWLTPIIRSLQGELLVTLRVAIPSDAGASPPVYDGVEIEYMPMQLIATQIDDVTVDGTLSYENLANEQWPPQSFNPFDFPGLF